MSSPWKTPSSLFIQEESALSISGKWASMRKIFLQVCAQRCAKIVEQVVEQEGAELLGWREVPVDPTHLGEFARRTCPAFRQVIVGRGGIERDAFEHKLYVIAAMILLTRFEHPARVLDKRLEEGQPRRLA